MSIENSNRQQDDTDPERMQMAYLQLLEQIAKRDQKIEWVKSERAAALRALEEKDKVLAERESLLRFTEGQLRQVLDSRAWKIAAWIQRMRLTLVPPESRRARVLEKALNRISPSSGKTGKN